MIQQKIANGMFGASATTTNGMLFDLLLLFSLITAIMLIFSVTQRVSSRRKKICSYVSYLKEALQNNEVATKNGFLAAKKEYDDIYEAHQNNSSVYLTNKENSFFVRFLETYSNDFEVHEFKTTEMQFAIRKILFILKLIFKAFLIFGMAYSHMLVSPNGLGFSLSIVFGVIAIIITTIATIIELNF